MLNHGWMNESHVYWGGVKVTKRPCVLARIGISGNDNAIIIVRTSIKGLFCAIDCLK